MQLLDLALAALPASAGLLTFRRVPSGEWDFVYDDNHNFVDILEISRERVRWYFTEAMVLGVYEPMSLTFKALFVFCFGWDPTAFHLLALALHATNAALAFLLGRSLLELLRPVPANSGSLGRALGCAMGASLFACHPGAVQTVCWVSCLPYVFAALFSQLCLLSLLRAVRGAAAKGCARRWALLFWRPASSLLGVVALLCKTAALPLVAVLCAVEFASMSRGCGESSTLLRRLVPRRALLAVLKQCVTLAVGLGVLWKGTGGYHLEELVRLSSRDTLLRACFLLVLYPAKIADPWHDFNVMQAMPYDGLQSVITRCWLCAGLVAVGAAWTARGVLLALDTSPSGAAASPVGGAAAWLLACYVAMIAPGLGLHSHTADQLYADRYLYLPAALLLAPSCGLLLDQAGPAAPAPAPPEQAEAAGGGTAWAARGAPRPLLLGALGGAAVAYHVGRSGESVEHWRSNRALWAHAVQVQPWNHRWWYNYAQELADSSWPSQDPHDHVEALLAVERSLELHPAVYADIARAEHLQRLGRLSKAVGAWEEALRHHSSDFEQHSSGHLIQLPSEKYRILCGLGRARLRTKDFGGARAALAECLRLYPQHTAAVCTRRQAHAHLYASRRVLPPGVWWHQAPGERRKPGVLCAMPACARGCLLYHLGLAHFEQHEWAEAAAALQRARDHRYAPGQAFLTWGAALYRLGEHAGARTVWLAGLAADPKPSPHEEAQLRGNLLALERARAEAAARAAGPLRPRRGQAAGDRRGAGRKRRRRARGRSGQGGL